MVRKTNRNGWRYRLRLRGGNLQVTWNLTREVLSVLRTILLLPLLIVGAVALLVMPASTMDSPNPVNPDEWVPRRDRNFWEDSKQCLFDMYESRQKAGTVSSEKAAFHECMRNLGWRETDQERK